MLVSSRRATRPAHGRAQYSGSGAPVAGPQGRVSHPPGSRELRLEGGFETRPYDEIGGYRASL